MGGTRMFAVRPWRFACPVPHVPRFLRWYLCGNGSESTQGSPPFLPHRIVLKHRLSLGPAFFRGGTFAYPALSRQQQLLWRGLNLTSCRSYISSLQGCRFVFSCGGLSPHNLGQTRSKILHLSQKMFQIRREIVILKDYDGTLSSFYRFSPHNPFCEPTPLVLWTAHLGRIASSPSGYLSQVPTSLISSVIAFWFIPTSRYA